MWKATKASLLAHKLRLILTAMAVTAGVGFVCGTLVLTDTLAATFDTLFQEVSSNKSVIVTGKSATGDTDNQAVPPVRDSLIEQLRSVPGVAATRGDVFSFAQLVGPDNKPVAAVGGAPTFGTSHQDGPMSSTSISEGHAPKGPDEVAIDKATATKQKFKVGDKVRIVTVTGVHQYTLTGILIFGSHNNLAGATQVSWDLPTAQKVLGRPGHVDEVDLLAEKGVPDEVVRDRVTAALGRGYTVQTGKEAAAAQAQMVSKGFAFFNYFLGGFAVISLLVGSFIIVNTFSILVAQRTRELALFRALGASRRQVLTSVLGEAAVTGLVGSLVGVVGGILLAAGIKALFSAIGLDLPAGFPVLKPRTVALGLGVGLVVTTAAAVMPAIRASQVSPVAAMSGAPAVRKRSVFAAVMGRIAAIAIGAVLLFNSPLLDKLFGSRGYGILIPIGALLTFVGVVLLLALFASPLAGVVGYPLARLGIVGRLGKSNATRNPTRTAATAAALMVSLALVGGAGTVQASANASIGRAIDKVIKADFVLQGTGFNAGLSPVLADSVRGRPGISEVASVTETRVKVGSTSRRMTAVTGGASDLINVEMISGSADALRDPNSILVEKDEATKQKLAIGDTIDAVFPKGKRTLKVGGFYNTNQLAGGYVFPIATYREMAAQALDMLVVVRAAPGQAATADKSIRETLVEFPVAKQQTRQQFIEERKKRTEQLLYIVVLLLVLSMIVAVLGVVNTLALSVYERTREVGLLRAVGTRRGQVASMVVVESVLVSLIGGILGLLAGIGIGGGVVILLSSHGLNQFQIPYAMVIAGLIFSIGAGVAASLFPAFKATRLNVLEAVTID